MKHLLPPVTYYKANFHTHSTVSDGKLTPEELRDAYKAKGYSILAITDHSVMVQHQDLNQPDFLLLTGVEIDMEEQDNEVNLLDRKLHMCLIGKDPYRQWIPFRDPRPIAASVPFEAGCEIAGLPRKYDPESINAVIAECSRQGFLVTYNHPCWSLESYPDYAPLKGLWAMEYRNTASIGEGYDENNSRVYQDLLLLGNRLMPVCADDTHRPTDPRSGYPVLGDSWNMIGAEKLEYGTVIEAMERGDLYASCGPEINSLTWDGASLHITCSPAARVQVLTHTRCAKLAYAGEGEPITEASFDMSGWLKRFREKENAFLRLIVTAADGSYAVTRAYFVDELTEQYLPI